MTTRHTGAIATVLDPEVLLAAARTILAADPAHRGADVAHGPLPQMLIAVDRGVPAIVNGAGVGAVLDAEHPDSIPVTFQAGAGRRAIPIPLEVIADAWTDQAIDLVAGVPTDAVDEWRARYDQDHNPQV